MQRLYFEIHLNLLLMTLNTLIGEYRFLSIGKSGQGQLLVVSYTEEEENHIRIISARLATKEELKNYENDR